MEPNTFLDFLPTNFRHEKTFFIQQNLIDYDKSLSRSTPYELQCKIGRLERSLRVQTETNVTFALLKKWIKRAKEVCKSL